MTDLNLWERIKNWFRKEADYLVGASLTTVFDHPRVNADREDFNRIRDSLRMYSGEYDDIEYLNSSGEMQKREYFHLNMMKEVSKVLKKLMVNENAEIKIDDDTADEFIGEVFEDAEFVKNLKRYVEPMLSLGGLSAKPYYDSSSGKIDFSWSLADTFIPLQSNSSKISECVIPSVTRQVVGDKTIYYTLLEFHEWGEDGSYIITNELYRSDNKDKVGNRVRLSELYEDMAEETVYENFSQPNFAYLSPDDYNNINIESPLGIGICDNAKTTLKQINDVYDQFHWEIKQGKRRIAASDGLTRTSFDEEGQPRQRFDRETDVFVPLRGEMDQLGIKDLTVSIRSTEYIDSINKFFETLEMQTGLSAGTFTFKAQGVQTATEVVSRDSTTYKTRNAHMSNVEKFIKDLIISTLELARETIGIDGVALYTGEIPTAKEISVDFDDGIFDSRDSKLDFWSKAKTFGLASHQQAIKQLYDLTDEQAEELYQQIKQEQLDADPYYQQRRAESSLLGGVE